MVDDILYSPIEPKKEEAKQENTPEWFSHDWDSGAQCCTICSMDYLDYLAYGFSCRRK